MYNDDPVIYFDALTALLDLSNFVDDNDDDDTLSPALGLLVDGNNAEALTIVGHLADGVKAPLVLSAPLGPLANQSDLSGDNDISGAGPGGVDGIPVGKGATGDDGTLGSLANGYAAPLALLTAPTTFFGSDAPPALTTALGPLADAKDLSEGHNAMDKDVGGNVDAPIDNSATGNCVLGLTANGGIDPLAFPCCSERFVHQKQCPSGVFHICWLAGQRTRFVGGWQCYRCWFWQHQGCPYAAISRSLYPLSIAGMREWGGNRLRRLGGQGWLHR